jgi:putative membrane protein insertion efficiency factor
MKRILLAALVLYRWWISPAIHAAFPSHCRFEPTCSAYAMEAIRLHGSVTGSRLALGRLLRCHPFGSCGYDPVPLPDAPESGAGMAQQPAAAARLASDPVP